MRASENLKTFVLGLAEIFSKLNYRYEDQYTNGGGDYASNSNLRNKEDTRKCESAFLD
jgi:hypothetical protein